MRFIRALVTTEVDGGVTRIVGRCRRRSTLLFEALERCPCLDQGTVDGEVFLAQKPCTASLLDHASEETLGDVRLDKTLPVLRECTRIEPPLRHVHVQEPAKEKVVVELLAEETLAAHRVEGHQQRRLEQSFGRDGRPAHLRVHPIECNCEVRQCHIDELLDRARPRAPQPPHPGRGAPLEPAPPPTARRLPVPSTVPRRPLLCRLLLRQSEAGY